MLQQEIIKFKHCKAICEIWRCTGPHIFVCTSTQMDYVFLYLKWCVYRVHPLMQMDYVFLYIKWCVYRVHPLMQMGCFTEVYGIIASPYFKQLYQPIIKSVHAMQPTHDFVCLGKLDFIVNDIAECPLTGQTSLMSYIMVWDPFSASYPGSNLHNTHLLYPIPSPPFFEFSLLVCANCDLFRVS